jgi:predicted phosphodiesterase
MKILVIPDTQVRDGVNLDHLEACGRYIIDKKPDVIVHIGDHFDMPSVSYYNKKIEVEGQRIVKDIDSGKEGMARLMKPLMEYNAKKKKQKKRPYTLAIKAMTIGEGLSCCMMLRMVIVVLVSLTWII